MLDLITALGASADSDAGRVLWALIGVVLSIVGTFWVQGALTDGGQRRPRRADRHDDRRALLAHASPFLGALIVAGILAAIGIGIGLILFIAPGLYLL